MTKGQARELYLRYLGEAKINGASKADPDLSDAFDYLLPGALSYVAAQFHLTGREETVGLWKAPAGFWAVKEARDKEGAPVPFEETGEGEYRFAAPCTVVYDRLPRELLPSAPDTAELDVLAPAEPLVPLKCAVDAAVGSEAHAYKVGYLSQSYNAMAAALTREDQPQFRRRFQL